MGLFGGNTLDRSEIKGWVINFAQNQRFTDEVFVGALKEETANRGDTISYKYHSAGAKDREQSKKVHRAIVNQNNVYSFSQGEIDPRPVKMIFPQGMMDYMSKFSGSEMPDSPDLGAVLGKMIYTQQDMIQMMSNYAENKPEELKDMRDQYKQMDLVGQENIRNVNRVMNQVLNSGGGKRRKKKRRR